MSTALLMILMMHFFGEMVSQFGVEEACKVTVEPFVADKFVAETKARHESMLFAPTIKQSEKNIKNTTISHQNGGGGHDHLLVSRLTGMGLARNKNARVEQQVKERGRGDKHHQR
jgi:hypothetical protein